MPKVFGSFFFREGVLKRKNLGSEFFARKYYVHLVFSCFVSEGISSSWLEQDLIKEDKSDYGSLSKRVGKGFEVTKRNSSRIIICT